MRLNVEGRVSGCEGWLLLGREGEMLLCLHHLLLHLALYHTLEAA